MLDTPGFCIVRFAENICRSAQCLIRLYLRRIRSCIARFDIKGKYCAKALQYLENNCADLGVYGILIDEGNVKKYPWCTLATGEMVLVGAWLALPVKVP